MLGPRLLLCQPNVGNLEARRTSACGRWLVSTSGSFLEPQLELHVPRGSANLRSIPTTVARNSTRR
jgi:hypothetical protein